jgi:hypothetical protein
MVIITRAQSASTMPCTSGIAPPIEELLECQERTRMIARILVGADCDRQQVNAIYLDAIKRSDKMFIVHSPLRHCSTSFLQKHFFTKAGIISPRPN